MEQRNRTKIINVEKSYLVSDILESLNELLKSQLKSDEISVEKEADIGKKDAIVTTIIIGLATNAIYDILKNIITRYSKRGDYNNNINIQINNITVSLDDIKKQNEINVK